VRARLSAAASCSIPASDSPSDLLVAGEHLVEVDETLAQAVDALLGALAPEGQALAGRDIRVQRRAHVEQQLGGLADCGEGRGFRPALAVQRVFIVEGAICDAGRNQQTDNEAGNANGPAKHQGTE
jgi:hypothetical protein